MKAQSNLRKLNMKKAKRPSKQKRGVGRPRTTGTGTSINVRCQPEFLKRVGEWQADKAPELSRQKKPRSFRAEAIRRLAEIGLDHEGH